MGFVNTLRILALALWFQLASNIFIALGLLVHLAYALFVQPCRRLKHRRVRVHPAPDWSDRSDVPPGTPDAPSYRVCIIGAGFSGIGTAIKLKQVGMTSDDVVVLERASSVGGTWRDNQYPGCAVDVMSVLYSFSFEPNCDWSHFYAPQPELWQYLERVTDKYNIRNFMQFHHTATNCSWDPIRLQWKIEAVVAAPGKPKRNVIYYANTLVNAAGPLSEISMPAIPGADTFQGPLFHSGQWDHTFNAKGKRVAIIGCGASAVQIVPEISKVADHVVLFQRTPGWVFPRQNAPIGKFRRFVYRYVPYALKLHRLITFWRMETAAVSLTYQSSLIPLAALCNVLMTTFVKDEALRKKLTPSFVPGCKRIIVSDVWYQTICSPAVTNVFSGLKQIKANSVIADDGSEHQVDAIIFATGYSAQVKDKRKTVPFTSRTGRSLAGHADEYLDGTHLGITTREFPNMFHLMGPNTLLGTNSVVFMMECQIDYIVQAIVYMRRRRHRVMEVKPAVAKASNEKTQQALKRTVWNTGGCRSWYLDNNGRNTTVYPHFPSFYRLETQFFSPSDFNFV